MKDSCWIFAKKDPKISMKNSLSYLYLSVGVENDFFFLDCFGPEDEDIPPKWNDDQSSWCH